MRMIRVLHANLSIQLAELPANVCPLLITDRHWLAENVLCLLSNAVKYSDGGAICIDVGLTYVRDQDLDAGGASSSSDADASSARPMVRISVEDSGIGVPDAVRATLFQPFHQGQKMAGGTGLGLYSLRKRMEALGGRCGVASRSDGARGSAFWFEFPYRADPSASASPRAASSSTLDGLALGTVAADDELADIFKSKPSGAFVRAVSFVRLDLGVPASALAQESAVADIHEPVLLSLPACVTVADSPIWTLRKSGSSVSWAVRRQLQAHVRAPSAGSGSSSAPTQTHFKQEPLRIFLSTSAWFRILVHSVARVQSASDIEFKLKCAH